MAKVSVIVCVYNAEKTLEKCLNSILNQDLLDFEVICVNDGSTDRSKEILDVYAKKDSRVKLIHQDNKGPFRARINGCIQAASPYVMFCDSDDWILPKALSRLYCAINSLGTGVTISRQYALNDGILTPSNLNNALLLKFGEKPFTNKESEYALFGAHLGLVAKIFKKEIFLEACSKVNSDFRIGEDALVLFSSYLLSERVSLIYDFTYVYRQDNDESLTHRKGSIAEGCRAWKFIFDYIENEKIEGQEILRCVLVKKFCINFSWQLSRCKSISIQDKDSLEYMHSIIKYCNGSMEYKRFLKEYRKRLNKGFVIAKDVIPRISKTKDFRILEFFGKTWKFPRKSYKKRLSLSIDVNSLYKQTLDKLKEESRYRKIKVCFYVSEKQKWQTEKLFQLFRMSDRYLCSFVFSHDVTTSYEDNLNYFKGYGVPVFLPFETKPMDFDIIFYQQPWCVDKKWTILEVVKYSLTCYIPYCAYCLSSPNNNINGFHGDLWRYFTDSSLDLMSNQNSNKVFLGSTKLESILNKLNQSRKTNKLKIVYSPHHSFNEKSHRMATWHKFGKEILNLAKTNTEFDWVFRPHPRFDYEVQVNKLATFQELHSYYSDWELVGTVDRDSRWEDLLADCDLLITDCISFLFDFSVQNKPLIHLRSLNQREVFTESLQEVIDSYMQVYDLDQLRVAFQRFKNADCLILKKSNLNSDNEVSKNASENIFNYINKEILS